MKKKGVFICIEGLDGCGKTTQAKLLAASFRESHKALYTAEPSQGKIGMFLRNRYLYAEKRASTVIETLLFAGDRFDHIEKVIIPALKKGRLVISDRYVYSSLAYQGASGLSLKWIESVNKYALRPDMAVFLDVDPNFVIQRLKQKKSVMENLATQQEVRKIYLNFVQKGSLVRVDGNKSKNAVANDLLHLVGSFLN